MEKNEFKSDYKQMKQGFLILSMLLIPLMAVRAMIPGGGNDSVIVIEQFSNCFRYQDFYLSGQPSLKMLKWLRQEGVVSIINLRTEEENDDFEEMAFNEAEMARDLGFEYHSVPVDGFEAYTPGNLEKMASLLVPGKKVLIHCAGAGRVTSFFMAYLFKYEGYNIDEAVEVGKQLKFIMPLEELLDVKIHFEVSSDNR